MHDPSDAQSQLSRFPCRSRWAEWLMLMAVLLAGSVAIAHNLADADLWGHVTFGKNVLERGSLPATATHTFTAEGYRWINHENLSELTLAAVANLSGGTGLLLMKFLFGVFVLGAILIAARRGGVPMMPICLVLLLVAVNLTATWTLRPQIFSYVLFTAMILCLDRAFKDYNPEGKIHVGYLWGIVALLFVWANTHGGFVAGYGIFAVVMVGRAIEALVRFGRRTVLGVWRLALITICGGLATLINPYGPNLHRWLFESLGQPRPEITEWIAMSLDATTLWPLVALLAMTAISLFASRARRDWTQMVVLGIVAWQSVTHLRHVPFLAILVGFWLPRHVASAWHRFEDWRAERAHASDRSAARSAAEPPLFVISGLAIACLVLAVLLGRRFGEVEVDKTEFPVDAIHFMSDQGLTGRLVVTYNWAQYALAALGPETTVAFDGRFRTCYPQEVVDMHFDLVLGDAPHLRSRSPASPPVDGRRVLDFLQPDLVLIDRRQRPSVNVLSSHEDWTLLYQDAVAQVWGRRSRFDTPGSRDYLPRVQRRINDRVPVGFARWPAMPDKRTSVAAEIDKQTQPSALVPSVHDVGQQSSGKRR